MDIISTTNDRLELTGEVSGTPEEVFRYWVEPELLASWWAQEAEVEPHEGGGYVLSWPAMGWHLRGRYTVVEPGSGTTSRSCRSGRSMSVSSRPGMGRG